MPGIQLHGTESARRLGNGYRSKLPVTLVEFEQRVKINRRQAVTVSHHTSLIPDEIGYPLQSTARQRLKTRIHQSYLPRLCLALMNDDFIAAGIIKSHIRVVEIIVGKILLDHIAFIAEADHKVVKPVVRVHFHNMPKNRLLPNLNHRLRPQMRFLTDTSAVASCQNNGFH
ncbi:hypothetical protein D3C71_1738380 [compost metagenome]